MRDVITALHDTAIAQGRTHRIDPLEEPLGHRTKYFARGFAIEVRGEDVTFTGPNDVRAFLWLCRTTDSLTVPELMFDAAIPCCHCIDDKCTTLLMERQRTIEYDGKRKKLCGPYRRSLRITNHLRTDENTG